MPSPKSSSPNTPICPICGSPYQVTDGSNPQIVCATCGYVLLFFYELERMRSSLKPLPDNIRCLVKNNRKRIKKQLKLKRRRQRKYMKHLTHRILTLVLALVAGLIAVVCLSSCGSPERPTKVDDVYTHCLIFVGGTCIKGFDKLKVSDLDMITDTRGTHISVVERDEQGRAVKYHHWQGHNVSVMTTW